MTLTLSIRRCPEGVPAETRRITGGVLNIGRSPANEWVLPDPDRVLSKRHCMIASLGEGWQVTDTSVNGTFLNDEETPLGSDAPRFLRSGDRLLMGSYEIEVMLQGVAPQLPLPPAPLLSGGERLTGDPFPAMDDDPFAFPMATSEVPFAIPSGPSARIARTTPDHASAMQESFRAPRPGFGSLPEDWDLEEPLAAPAPVQADPPVRAEREAAPMAGRTMGATSGATEAFAAFADGAGMAGPPPAEPLAVLRGLGSAFRAVVHGLRRAMMARATVKGGFRIDQTMIQAIGNNPLKFSADDDDALGALLGIGRHGDMTAERAVREAMRDIRLHELAMTAAMQQAVRDMLAQLAPARLEQRIRGGALDQLPGQRKRHLWDAYVTLHRETEQALSDNYDSVFGRSFMRAYERAMQDILASEPD